MSPQGIPGDVERSVRVPPELDQVIFWKLEVACAAKSTVPLEVIVNVPVVDAAAAIYFWLLPLKVRLLKALVFVIVPLSVELPVSVTVPPFATKVPLFV
jgi:hypothetical protein